MKPVAERAAWERKAALFAAAVPRARLHRAVLAWACRRTAAARGPWVVAFSGGADSLALLLALWTHWPRRRRVLMAVHFNHRLRGSAAAADERFCRSVCRALGVRLYVGRWARARAGASEEEAREARFAFLGKAMKAAGARALWLGHHQSDVAETMLMRLARGSGASGLAAPRPVQKVAERVHLRPLLGLKKEAIAAALRAAGVKWMEDRTNTGRGYFRNRIRLDVVPAWQKAAGRDAIAGAALARELIEEDDEALEAWVAKCRPFERGGRLSLARLAGCPRAVVRRALRRWLLRQSGAEGLSRQGFEDLLDAVIAGRPTRRSLGRAGFAVIRGGRLHRQASS